MGDRMEIYATLEEAKTEGRLLALRGGFPTIYKRDFAEYIVVTRREWPPPRCWPFLKWVGRSLGGSFDEEWIPVLARLNSIEHAQEACGLFHLLGHDPIIVEFPGITYDLFLREEHVPSGALIVVESAGEDAILQLHPPRYYDEEEFVEIDMQFQSH